MIKKLRTIQDIMRNKVVMVVRCDDSETAETIVHQAIRGGLRSIELTMSISKVFDSLQRLQDRYSQLEGFTIGVGTVLDATTARLAIHAGADFVVSPHLNAEVVTTCHRYGVPIFPGTMSICEIVSALEQGVDIIKLFPSNHFGLSIIKDIKGPLPHANIMPTSGIHLGNFIDWLDAGAVAVGTGSSIYGEGIKTRNPELIARQAEKFVEKITAHYGSN